MKRLIATVRCDARLQLRNGFYYATAFVVAVYALGLSQLPAGGARAALAWLLPAMVLNNLVITAFYFVGGLVLLEKAEGSLQAQVVTPLRAGEYLAARTITLAALALAHNLAVAFIAVGASFSILPLALGAALGAAIFVLLGFVAVSRYDSINEFLLPSGAYVAVLLAPLVYVAGWDVWPLYLHPLQGPLVLLRAAVEPAQPWRLAYGALASALWTAVSFALARRAFRNFVAAPNAK